MIPSGSTARTTTERGRDLARNLEGVRARISAAVAAAGREDEPGLIVVTKFHPADDVLTLADLGVTDVGENREQEAGPKAAQVTAAGADLNWHFIGQLQSNKASRVLRFSREIHSVDRTSLVSALEKAARRLEDEDEAAVEVGCYLQVDLRTDASLRQDPKAPRGGVAPEDLLPLAEAVARAEHLRLRGVMAVAPLGEEPRGPFERLAELSQRLRVQHPEAVQISAGMSHDLEEAVRIGATRLRIGTEVLGPRPVVG
jgi:pyridoxal phosphate enzyme (YggS family)